jgi:hypothetical protein
MHTKIKGDDSYRLEILPNRRPKCLSQRIGEAAEVLCENTLKCPTCNSKNWLNMNKVHANYPAIDLQCHNCSSIVQVKTSTHPIHISKDKCFQRISSENETRRFIKEHRGLFYLVRIEYNENNKRSKISKSS